MPFSPDGQRNPDVESAILRATETLLETTPVQDLPVEDILKASRISRATFYVYFASKYAVIARLMQDLLGQIEAAFDEWLAPEHAHADGRPAFDQALLAAVSLWSSHPALMRTVSGLWHHVPELAELWPTTIERITDKIATKIDGEREAGRAPGTAPPSRVLAATLVWSTERCVYVANLSGAAVLLDEEATISALSHIWQRSIYGIDR